MSGQSHQRFLEEAAVREARRVFDVERRPATLSSFLALRVQTVEPWKRIVCVLLGLLFGTFAAWLADDHQGALWAAGFFGILAVIAVAVGAIGWKRPVDAVLNATSELIFRRILDVL